MVRLGSTFTMSIAIVALLLAGCEAPKKAVGGNTALMLIGYQGDYLNADGRLPVAQDRGPSAASGRKRLDQCGHPPRRWRRPEQR